MDFKSSSYSTDVTLQDRVELKLEQLTTSSIKSPTQRFRIDSHRLIYILSIAIVLLGLIHNGFAFFEPFNQALICFVGYGTAIVFSGLLNLIALERGGSKFSKTIGLIVNGISCLLCCIAAVWFKSALQFFEILIFLITTISFFVDWKRGPL